MSGRIHAHALVLGGSGHVGAAVVRGLRGQGLPTTFTFHRSRERAAALAVETGAVAHSLDLRDAATVERALASLSPPPDVLVHCAGVGAWRTLGEIDAALFDETLAVNARAAFLACRALVPRMADGGDVVLVSALDGIAKVPSPTHFAMSQAALLGLAHSLAKEAGPRGVRTNIVVLGPLDGGLSASLSPDLVAQYRAFSALGRTGTAEEAARAIVRLALENTYMNGAELVLTGGI